MTSQSVSKNITISIKNDRIIVGGNTKSYTKQLKKMGGKKSENEWTFDNTNIIKVVDWVKKTNLESESESESDTSDEIEEWKCDGCSKWYSPSRLNSKNMCKLCIKNDVKRKHNSDYSKDMDSDCDGDCDTDYDTDSD